MNYDIIKKAKFSNLNVLYFLYKLFEGDTTLKDKKIKIQNKEEIQAKFIMSGLTIVMMATLFIYYLGAVINNKYLVSFSVDSIVGVLSFAMMIKNFSIKYKLLSEFKEKNFFILIDILSLLACLLAKFLLKIPFDLSLPILVIAYFLGKKKFDSLTA